MSVIYNSSSIISNCVVHIDAANPKCYPGTGQIAYDLSGNSKHGTINGPTFSAGKFSFDGVNDVIDFGTGNTVFPLPQISHEFVFRSLGTVPVTGTSPGLCGITYGIRILIYSTYLYVGIDNGTTLLGVNTIGTNNFYNGAWNHLVTTHDGQQMKVYLNGVLNTSLSCAWLGVTRWPTNQFNIGRDNNNQMYFFYGDISIFRLYNIALSADQIATNFRQIRGRYSI